MALSRLKFSTALAATALMGAVYVTPAAASSVAAAGLWTETNGGAAPAATQLEFFNLTTLFVDGFFTGYTLASVTPLNLERSGNTAGGTPRYVINTSEFEDVTFTGIGWKTYENEAGDQITFDLDLNATWERTFAQGGGNYEQDAIGGTGLFEYTGTYNLPNGSTVRGFGELNASSSGTARAFEITQAAVPLPAGAWLLMGAMGMMTVAKVRRKRPS